MSPASDLIITLQIKHTVDVFAWQFLRRDEFYVWFFGDRFTIQYIHTFLCNFNCTFIDLTVYIIGFCSYFASCRHCVVWPPWIIFFWVTNLQANIETQSRCHTKSEQTNRSIDWFELGWAGCVCLLNNWINAEVSESN